MVKQIKKNTLRYPAELDRFTTLAPDSNINFSSINYLFNSTFCNALWKHFNHSQFLNFFMFQKRLNSATVIIRKSCRINWQLIKTTLHICISSNFECSKQADHIWEMAGLGLFCDYFFTNHICKVVVNYKRYTLILYVHFA